MDTYVSHLRRSDPDYSKALTMWISPSLRGEVGPEDGVVDVTSSIELHGRLVGYHPGHITWVGHTL